MIRESKLSYLVFIVVWMHVSDHNFSVFSLHSFTVYTLYNRTEVKFSCKVLLHIKVLQAYSNILKEVKLLDQTHVKGVILWDMLVKQQIYGSAET